MIYVDHFQSGKNSPLIQTAPPFLPAIPTVDTARKLVQALKGENVVEFGKGVS
jgi:hypothetical protein